MKYHHGDLRRALLDVLPGVIADQGLDKLSLREVARRAGVTHGAPAHHFGDKRGLLTAFATEGSLRLEQKVLDQLQQVAPRRHPQRLTAVGLGYLEFAIADPAHFQVTFRSEWLDLEDVDYVAAGSRAGQTLDLVLNAAQMDGWLRPKHYADVRMAAWALAHGYACLASDVFVGMPTKALREQARSAFDHFGNSVLKRPTTKR